MRFFILIFTLFLSSNILASEYKNFKPLRIVSTCLVGDEILLRLFENSGSSMQRILALSTLADDANYSGVQELAKKVAKRVGSNIEQIIELKPDLVIAAHFNRPEFLQQLSKFKAEIYVVSDLNNFTDIIKVVRDIANLVQLQAVGENIIFSFFNEKEAYRRISKKPFTVLSWDESQIVFGANTLFNTLIEEAGGKNLIAELGLKGWPKVSEEVLLKLNPDFILIAHDNPKLAKMQLRNDRIYQKFNAVKKNKIIVVPKRLLYSTSLDCLKTVREIKKQI